MADIVNSPGHYVVSGLPECVEVIEGLDMPWHLGNVMKYLWRAGRKTEDVLTDLKKARWYLDRYIQKLEK